MMSCSRHLPGIRPPLLQGFSALVSSYCGFTKPRTTVATAEPRYGDGNEIPPRGLDVARLHSWPIRARAAPPRTEGSRRAAIRRQHAVRTAGGQ
jgi:hypothetical protein